MDGQERKRLLAYLDARSVRTPAGCLDWCRSHRDTGDGQMWWGGRNHTVHRMKWIALHGPIPPKMQVRQTCGNSICIEEMHLKLATHAECVREARKLRVAAGR